MPRSARTPDGLAHPDAADIDLLDVLHALSDRTRMTIVQTLYDEPERACGTFPVDVAASTLSHHFRVLRDAGVIRQREEGTRRWTSLRRDDLEARFPGVLDGILNTLQPAGKRTRDARPPNDRSTGAAKVHSRRRRPAH